MQTRRDPVYLVLIERYAKEHPPVKQVITFLQKVNYIGNTYKLMKTFINRTVMV